MKKLILFIFMFIAMIGTAFAELDPIAAIHVNETETSQIISMDRLRLTEDVTSESIGKAKRNMARALKGEISKRKPLTVVNRGDGSYCIFDGNNTYSALKELGAKNVPVTILKVPYQKGIKGFDDLMAKNSEVQSEFHNLMSSLSHELGAKLIERPGLKSESRIHEKVKNSFGGDYSRVIDVLAASLIFKSESELLGAVEKLKGKSYVVHLYDRWNKLRDDGYRDYITYVRLSNGIIAELQLHHEKIIDVKNTIAHSLYEFIRSNQVKNEMLDYVKQANEIHRRFYELALNGKFEAMNPELKTLASELAHNLSTSKTPEDAAPLLNRLVMIVDNELKTPEIKFFDNPEINKLIDENYKLVNENGYAELRIPERLHKISRKKFSHNAIDAAQKLIDAGFQAYVFGGAVRDLILGAKVNDTDLKTNATIEEQEKIFASQLKTHVHENGMTYGFVIYPDEVIDLSTTENIRTAYRGKKNIPDTDPNEAWFSKSIFLDSFGKDMTLNGLYYDISTGDIIDFHGGLYAIREGIIDSVIDPEIEFVNGGNSSASLRAFRFKSRYGFRFSDRLEKAFRQDAVKYMKLLEPTTNSRYLHRMFNEGVSRRNYDAMNEYKIFGYFFPPVSELSKTPEYKIYASSAMDLMDKEYKSGNKNLRNMMLASLLWPAVKNSDAEGIKIILNEQEKVFAFDKGEKETLTEIFMIEKEIQNINSTELIKREHFNEAYILLKMRAETDKSLKEILTFWEKIMTEKELKEAA